MAYLVKIAGTFLVLLVYHYIWQINGASSDNIIWLALPMMLIFGIPHGATDHVLHNFSSKKIISQKADIQFLQKYIFILLGYATLWWITPSLSLLFFLLVSSYHFGETQWLKHGNLSNANNLIQKIIYLSWGASVICMLFYLYPTDTNYYLKDLLDQNHFIFSSSVLFYMGLGNIIIWFILMLIYQRFNQSIKIVLDFALLATIFYFSDLLVGFTIFFTLWHSLDAISLQVSGLSKLGPKFEIIDFIKAAIPFTVISIVGIITLLIVFYHFESTIPLITVFIIAISMLTLPHHLEVGRFYYKLGTKNT